MDESGWRCGGVAILGNCHLCLGLVKITGKLPVRPIHPWPWCLQKFVTRFRQGVSIPVVLKHLQNRCACIWGMRGREPW